MDASGEVAAVASLPVAVRLDEDDAGRSSTSGLAGDADRGGAALST
jgi:hypothetical protein